MTAGPPPPRPTRRRRYPLSAYVPFTIIFTVIVVIPVLLLILLISLIAHLVAPSHPTATPTPTATLTAMAATRRPTAHATVSGRGTPIPGLGPVLLPPRPTATVTATRPVTIALGVNNGAPVNPASVIHGPHITLYAFATIPNVHTGDTLRFIWRDLTRGTIVEDFPITVRTSAASYSMYMDAFPGNTPSQPFPAGSYRVDVTHNGKLVASGSFVVTAR